MKSDKLVLSALAYVLISIVVNNIGAIFTMGYYTDPANSGLWSKLMMPGPQPPGMEFYISSIIFSLAAGAIFAYLYTLVRPALSTKQPFHSSKPIDIGLKFGLLLFALTSLTGFLSMFLLLAIPFGLLFAWLVSGLIVCLASGVAFAKLMG
jgi:hypothetical protein